MTDVRRRLKELILVSVLILFFFIADTAACFTIYWKISSLHLSFFLCAAVISLSFGFLYISFRYRFLLVSALFLFILLSMIHTTFLEYWFYRQLDIVSIDNPSQIHFYPEADGYHFESGFVMDNWVGIYKEDTGESYYAVPFLDSEIRNFVAPVNVFLVKRFDSRSISPAITWETAEYTALVQKSDQDSYLAAARNSSEQYQYSVSSYAVFLQWNNVQAETMRVRMWMILFFIGLFVFWTTVSALMLVPAFAAWRIENKDREYWNRKKFER